ncbi:MAG: 16S rRNA (guanine(527)-N(7))-methyltransferase RsmG [Dehalococcoidia bacterium]|nr:MAG: 16S rRNA (guanine(527)-N(7))-methyltransferase RsmG [Dehalococcoidia bacterium]
MTIDPLAPLLTEAERLGVDLDRRARERFARYLDLVLEWNERAGITSLTDPEEIQRRHFAESLSLLAALRTAAIVERGSTARIADLGSGGGFPGIPMAIAEPGLDLVLVESHGRRAEFLRTVVAALELPHAKVVQARAEDAGRGPMLRATFDLVTARALAPLPVLIEYALPLLKDGGLLVAPKGSRADEELAASVAALAALGGDVRDTIDLPLPEGLPPQRVIVVGRTGRLDGRYPRRAGIPSREPL